MVTGGTVIVIGGGAFALAVPRRLIVTRRIWCTGVIPVFPVAFQPTQTPLGSLCVVLLNVMLHRFCREEIKVPSWRESQLPF